MVLPLRNHYYGNGAYRFRFEHQNVPPIPGAKRCLTHASQLTCLAIFLGHLLSHRVGPDRRNIHEGMRIL